jgi:hypothetical protein
VNERETAYKSTRERERKEERERERIASSSRARTRRTDKNKKEKERREREEHRWEGEEKERKGFDLACSLARAAFTGVKCTSAARSRGLSRKKPLSRLDRPRRIAISFHHHHHHHGRTPLSHGVL